MRKEHIRNVAIIAHVDHGKTSLVDQLLRQSGQFGRGELEGDCILDSNPLERERGITILAKNCALDYKDNAGIDYHINIVDTPGHADFSGEVERVLRMADGVMLLVDAFEGVMPQTRYVLSKALELGLQPLAVVNKMDKPNVRPEEVLNEIFDLMVDLGADEEKALSFPVVYASARQGWAVADFKDVPTDGKGDIRAIFEAIIKHIPAPEIPDGQPLAALVTNIDYNDYVGRIGVGRVLSGDLELGKDVVVHGRGRSSASVRPTKYYTFSGLGKKETKRVEAGDLFSVEGIGDIDIGDGLCLPDQPVAFPTLPVEQPTLHMSFRINDGPFSGRDGKFMTSRQIWDRLSRELKRNVSLRVEKREDDFFVSGRGLLHLGVLLENMRREGYELTVGKPRVLFKEENGVKLEPMEQVVIDIPSEMQGVAMELMGDRKAELTVCRMKDATAHLEFVAPTRGLIGLTRKLLFATHGEAIINHRFLEYGPHRGPISGRPNGVMVATETGKVTAYALDGLSDRGIMFVEPGDDVYEGQIVGEHNKPNDIDVNVVRLKKLTNVRSATKEMTVILKVARKLTLETALEYIERDEAAEITPGAIRIRKLFLKECDRRRFSRQEAEEQGQ
jgi:GTP-binding protein